MIIAYMPDLFRVGSEVFSFGYSSIMVAKGSPLKDLFDMEVLRILESGIFEQNRRIELHKTGIPRRHKQIKRIDKDEPIQLRLFQPVLILLGCGFLLSFTWLLIEVAMKSFFCI